VQPSRSGGVYGSGKKRCPVVKPLGNTDDRQETTTFSQISARGSGRKINRRAYAWDGKGRVQVQGGEKRARVSNDTFPALPY